MDLVNLPVETVIEKLKHAVKILLLDRIICCNHPEKVDVVGEKKCAHDSCPYLSSASNKAHHEGNLPLHALVCVEKCNHCIAPANRDRFEGNLALITYQRKLGIGAVVDDLVVEGYNYKGHAYTTPTGRKHQHSSFSTSSPSPSSSSSSSSPSPGDCGYGEKKRKKTSLAPPTPISRPWNMLSRESKNTFSTPSNQNSGILSSPMSSLVVNNEGVVNFNIFSNSSPPSSADADSTQVYSPERQLLENVKEIFSMIPGEKNSFRVALLAAMSRNMKESQKSVADYFGVTRNQIRDAIVKREETGFRDNFSSLFEKSAHPLPRFEGLSSKSLELIHEFWYMNVSWHSSFVNPSIPVFYPVLVYSKESIWESYDQAFSACFPDSDDHKVSRSSFLGNMPEDISLSEIHEFACPKCRTLKDLMEKKYQLEVDDEKDNTAEVKTLQKEIDELTHHVEHVKHQRSVFRNEIENLKDDTCILVFDFSPHANVVRRYRTMNESNWGGILQCFHCCIISKKGGTVHREYYDFFSQDKHNTRFTETALRRLIKIDDCPLNSSTCQKIEVWSDGGPTDMKTKRNIAFVTTYFPGLIADKKKAKKAPAVTYNFYSPYHGKSICDAHAAHVKHAIKTEAKNNQILIGPEDMAATATKSVKHTTGFCISVDCNLLKLVADFNKPVVDNCYCFSSKGVIRPDDDLKGKSHSFCIIAKTLSPSIKAGARTISFDVLVETYRVEEDVDGTLAPSSLPQPSTSNSGDVATGAENTKNSMSSSQPQPVKAVGKPKTTKISNYFIWPEPKFLTSETGSSLPSVCCDPPELLDSSYPKLLSSIWNSHRYCEFTLIDSDGIGSHYVGQMVNIIRSPNEPNRYTVVIDSSIGKGTHGKILGVLYDASSTSHTIFKLARVPCFGACPIPSERMEAPF